MAALKMCVEAVSMPMFSVSPGLAATRSRNTQVTSVPASLAMICVSEPVGSVTRNGLRGCQRDRAA